MGLVYLYCLVCCCCSNGHLPSFTLEESSCGTEENILDLGQGWSSTLSLMSYVTLTSLLQVSVSSSANWNNNFDLRVPSRIKRNDACWVLHSARNLILHVSFPTLSVLERSAFKKKMGGCLEHKEMNLPLWTIKLEPGKGWAYWPTCFYSSGHPFPGLPLN